MPERTPIDDPLGYIRDYKQLYNRFTEQKLDIESTMRFVSRKELGQKDLTRYSDIQLRLIEQALRLLRDASRPGHDIELIPGLVQ